jgi:putative colanic acid biosysnthesis UDP-glucose lipid carrier transferase
MFILEALLNFAWYFFVSTTNFYDDFTARLFTFQTINIIKNIVVQIVISITFIFIVKEDLFTRNFIIYYASFLFLFVSLRSILFRKAMKQLRKKGRNLRHILIIGAGEVGRNFRELIKKNPDFGYRVKGYLSRVTDNDDEIIGNYEQLDKLLTSGSIDEVVIALPQEDYYLMDEIIKTCNRNAVRTHIIPDYFRFVSKRFRISMIGNFPIITSRNEPLEEVQWRAVKRGFDFVFSLIIVVFILSILFPVIAVILKITSSGPVLFVQERIGAKNRKFKCYKFRTLRVVNTPQYKFQPVIENDPRITPLGKLLRRTNIDELPQFINVLKGEMSIVGPRPYPIPYDDRYGKIFEEIKLRHNVKPGLLAGHKSMG